MKGTDRVGGIIGVVGLNVIVANNFNSGVVEGDSNVGCIIGDFQFNSTNNIIENNHYDKQMCGEDDYKSKNYS